MKAITFRRINRTIHLLGAAAIGTFVYSPWGLDPAFRLAMQTAVIPLLTLSGLAIWKQVWVMRLLGLRKAPASSSP